MMNGVVRDDGTVRVRIIGPGQGSSAYYEADQLRRDMGVFAKGTQVFFDHPGRREESDRPERSLRDLCGVTTTEPVWEEAGPAGPGPYTTVSVFRPYRPMLDEMGPHIGVSIIASGTVVPKKVNGKTIRVAEKFTSGRFDFVTKAGAGGKVVPFAEAARSAVDEYVDEFLADHPQESESSERARAQFIEWAAGGSPVTEEEEMELKEKVSALEAENAALKEAERKLAEALVIKEATEIIEESLGAEKDLPDQAKARLREVLRAKATPQEGELDKDALKASVAEAIKAEKEYVASLKPKGVVGMGGVSADDMAKRLRESRIASYLALGETQEAAERLADLAASGR
jgi:hypothetical protein